MAFKIRMGIPEMDAWWSELSTRKSQAKLDSDEEKFFKKLVKALGYLAENPRHNSLASHEIDDLTKKYGIKIFQSYLENNTPHPEDQKRGAYQRIKLSALPKVVIVKSEAKGPGKTK